MEETSNVLQAETDPKTQILEKENFDELDPTQQLGHLVNQEEYKSKSQIV
jgi:hypothetical protein